MGYETTLLVPKGRQWAAGHETMPQVPEWWQVVGHKTTAGHKVSQSQAGSPRVGYVP